MKRRTFIQNSIVWSAFTLFPFSGLLFRRASLKSGQLEMVSTPTPEKVMQDFEKRKQVLLRNTAGNDVTPEEILDTGTDLYSNRAIANLVLGRYMGEANRRISHTARWFDHPHPLGRSKDGECDFAAIKLCRAYYLFQNNTKLEDKTRKNIEHFFLTEDFRSRYPSENHVLMFRISRHLMAQMLPGYQFEAYGRKGRYFISEDARWIKDFIRFRARQGWGEFDSACYYSVNWYILTTLFDYTEDEELKQLTKMMLDLLLADMSVDSIKGMYGGAHGRIYPPHALDHANENTFPLQYLYFDMITKDQINGKGINVEALVSEYRPDRILVDLAINRSRSYENLERKHLHNTVDIKPHDPLKGTIRKYSYYTPGYLMGCVQLQDPYPPDCKGKWYAHHEQHQWDLTFADSTRARIFTHHPGKRGKEHNYWTGDLGCGCGHFFQHKSALISLYDIPEDQPYQLIHAYLPQKEFDEVIERNGIIFVRIRNQYAALKLLGGHEWTREGEWKNREVISRGGKNGTVCEVGHADDFGGFVNFQKAITANRIDFDAESMRLVYDSQNSGRLTMDTGSMRKLNDRQISLDYPTFRSPYMKSAWNSGLIRIMKDGKKMVLDFRDGEIV
jgi:hypothetical protein